MTYYCSINYSHDIMTVSKFEAYCSKGWYVFIFLGVPTSDIFLATLVRFCRYSLVPIRAHLDITNFSESIIADSKALGTCAGLTKRDGSPEAALGQHLLDLCCSSLWKLQWMASSYAAVALDEIWVVENMTIYWSISTSGCWCEVR